MSAFPAIHSNPPISIFPKKFNCIYPMNIHTQLWPKAEEIKTARLLPYVPLAANCFTKGVSCIFEAMAAAAAAAAVLLASVY